MLQIKEIHKNEQLDEQSFQALFKFYEERKTKYIDEAKKDREEIIEAEKNGISLSKMQNNNSKVLNVNGSVTGNSTLIEAEKKQLEKIKQKQKKELEQMMEYELKLQVKFK